MTLHDWITVWFETYSKPAIRPSTAESYQSFIKNHISPCIGSIPLDMLAPLDIQRMYNSIRVSGRVCKRNYSADQSLSSQLVRGVHSILSQCLEQAVRERMIQYNPVTGCKLPPKERNEMKVIPPDRIGVYLKAADGYGVLPMFFLELCTGLRRGELLALLWSDLNTEDLTISVTKQVAGRKGELVVSAPKTLNSIRVIAIPEQAAALLVTEHEKHPDNCFMFPSPATGKMYYPDSAGRLHKKILQKAGLEKNRFHDLRHPYVKPTLKTFFKEFFSMGLTFFQPIKLRVFQRLISIEHGVAGMPVLLCPLC